MRGPGGGEYQNEPSAMMFPRNTLIRTESLKEGGKIYTIKYN